MYRKTAILLFILFSVSFVAKAQDTITICKDVRGITFYIYTTQGKAVAWDWTTVGGTYSGSTTDSFCGPVFYNTAGVFNTTCKVTFSTGKDSLHKFVILVFDGKLNKPALKDTTICGTQPVLLDAGNAGNPLANYLWTPNGETTQTILATTAGVYSASVYSVDDYSYNVPNAYACDSVYTQINIIQGVQPIVDLGKDKLLCNSVAITLDGGPGGGTYKWSPGGQTTRQISTFIGGTYTVVVTSPDGCVGSDQVFLKDSCPSYVFVPDAFSPDETNLNDSFRWNGNMYIDSFHMIIFNRWGQEMFETRKKYEAWDGKHNGRYVTEGVYAYLIECSDVYGNWYNFRGSLTVFR